LLLEALQVIPGRLDNDVMAPSVRYHREPRVRILDRML